MIFSGKKALGIDISEETVRMVSLQACSGGYRVIGVSQLHRDDTDSLREKLRTLGAGAKIAVGIPASGCACKSIALPPAKPAELAQVVAFEAENQLPLPLDDLVWGYSLAPQGNGQQQATIIGTRRKTVDERLSGLPGVAPSAVLVSSLAAAATITHPDARHIVVVASEEWSDLCLFNGSELLACRSVRTAGEWAERIARELRAWIVQDEAPSLYMLGEVPAEELQQLRRLLSIPLVLCDPWREVVNAARMQQQLDASPAAFHVAIGLARTALQPRIPINLLPMAITTARQTSRKLGMALAALLVAIGLLLPLVLSNDAALSARKAELAAISARNKRLESRLAVVSLDGIAAADQTVKDAKLAQSSPLVILYQLSDKLPEGITLSSFSFNRNRSVVLKGRTKSNEEVASGMQAIVSSGFADRVMLNYARQLKDMDGYDFQITCTLPQGGKQ